MLKLIKVKAMAVVLCLMVFSSVLPTAVLAQPTISSEAEAHILSELRRAHIPNAAVAIIQDGETSYVLKDSAPDTLFQLASVAKPITAFGVLLLDDMGLLSVYDPVNWHLPWFEVRYNGVPVPHEDITIYNLIHHTSGIAQNENRFPRPTPTETTDEFIARLVGMELDFYPAASAAYSNMAYVILGLLIEAVSGQSYDDFMTQRVFHPLGLYNTFANPQYARDTGRVVSGHVRGFLQVWQGTRGLDRSIKEVPAGFIYSNVSDMARWAGIQLGIIDVPEQFARVVQRSHIPNLDANVAFASGYVFAGGWYINLETGYIEHSGGGTAGYSTLVRILPESNTAVVVLANLRDTWVENFAVMALDAAVDGTFTDVGRGFLEWIDIGFTLMTVFGVISFCLFVWLLTKVRRQLRSGAVIKSNFSRVGFKGSLGLVFSIAGLIFYYIFPYVLLDTTRESLLQNWPTSFAVAAIAIWISVLYDVFAWWVKVFVNPATKS